MTRRPPLTVLTIGHFRHGKTTLTAAITHLLANRDDCEAEPRQVNELTASRERAWVRLPKSLASMPAWSRDDITVRPAYVTYATSRRFYNHLDLPGLRGLVKTTARRNYAADIAVLVVAADESVGAQTREHALLARHAGAEQFVVFVNKCDRVDDAELIDAVEVETREVLADCGIAADQVPVVRGAALPALRGDDAWQQTVADLVDILDNDCRIPGRPSGDPIFIIDAVHPLVSRPRRTDQVVAGKLLQGAIHKRDALTLRGYGFENERSVTVVDMEIGRQKVDQAQAGDHLGLCLRSNGGPDVTVRNGQYLCPGEALRPRDRFTCSLSLLTDEQGGRHTPIFGGHAVYVHLAGGGTVGVIELPASSATLSPGARVSGAVVRLQQPMYLFAGMPFSFRDGCDGLARALGKNGKDGPGPLWSGTAGTGVVTDFTSEPAGSSSAEGR